MAKIKRSTAEQTKGINEVLSGSIDFLRFTKKGVITGLSNSIKVKRPNQYNKGN